MSDSALILRVAKLCVCWRGKSGAHLVRNLDRLLEGLCCLRKVLLARQAAPEDGIRARVHRGANVHLADVLTCTMPAPCQTAVAAGGSGGRVLTGLRRQAKRGELDRLLIRAVTLAHLRQHQRCGGKIQLACPQCRRSQFAYSRKARQQVRRMPERCLLPVSPQLISCSALGMAASTCSAETLQSLCPRTDSMGGLVPQVAVGRTESKG